MRSRIVLFFLLSMLILGVDWFMSRPIYVEYVPDPPSRIWV